MNDLARLLEFVLFALLLGFFSGVAYGAWYYSIQWTPDEVFWMFDNIPFGAFVHLGLALLFAALVSIPGYILFRRILRKTRARWPVEAPKPGGKGKKRERLSNKQDFPNVTIDREFRKSGKPVYLISFWNREAREGLEVVIAVCAGVGIFVGLGINPVVSVVCLVIAIVMSKPGNKKRFIEMDFDKGELRVKGGGRVTVRKPIIFANVTIEGHSEAEIEYQQLQGKHGKKQKQHCLVGWFGMAGADRAELICRYEWPNKNSLMEVQQAIMFCRELGVQEMVQQIEETGEVIGPEGQRLGPAPE